MGLQLRLYLLLGLMFAIVYAVVVAVATYLGFSSFVLFAGLAVGLVFLQYLIGPAIVTWSMKVKEVSESEEPELHRMVAELAMKAGVPKPKVCVSDMDIPNAFAYGRTTGDARICVTRGIMKLLNRDELKAVLGHEMTHVKNHDVVFITLLSVVPMICYYIALTLMWGGNGNSRNSRNSNLLPVIGIGMYILYFVSNLLVLYGSRIREYYADKGSVTLGNQPNLLATSLYKLAYSSGRMSKETKKQVDGVKAFFISDPAHSYTVVSKLREVDTNGDGIIDSNELMMLRSRKVNISFGDKVLELFGTHPDMLKRIKHLASLSVQPV